MPAPTPDDVRSAAETLAQLTEHLREDPDLDEAIALMEPLLDEYTGLPMQLGDSLRALARAVLAHPDIPNRTAVHALVDDLRTAAWEQTDQHTLHYTLDNLRTLARSAPSTAAGS
ncbi:hypothetical protein [Streptomyces nigrescens]|uniref:Uncharacterized protein n=1 Tax=Streptomyces nigrescens TaxID=1920 RepID=A0ABY7J1R8_STRNI|nr:hypothetical protein [Streptomyces nigrescens]WAU04084.1 hypothetical protein STRNI_002315 [Streptomyces nigrescens]